METATDFSQNIKKQLTNTLYVVSVDGNTNVLYMNAITGECNLVFDTRIAIDNVMIKYHNTIENDDMAILEFEYLGNDHKEVLLRNGEKVSEDMDNVSMFYSITDISENLFSYDRGDEMNIIDRFGINKFERYHDGSEQIIYVSDMINDKNIIIGWSCPFGKITYNIYDMETNKLIMDNDAEYVCPTNAEYVCPTQEGWVRTKGKEECAFIVISENKCYMINTNNSIISAQLSCKVNFMTETLIDNHNNQKVSFDCLEDYLDEYGDMLEEEKETDTESDKLVSLLNCIKEKGMPKQVIICSENAVRAYSEIKKLEIKDKKLFIENCLCEFNNDEQVNFIY